MLTLCWMPHMNTERMGSFERMNLFFCCLALMCLTFGLTLPPLALVPRPGITLSLTHSLHSSPNPARENNKHTTTPQCAHLIYIVGSPDPPFLPHPNKVKGRVWGPNKLHALPPTHTHIHTNDYCRRSTDTHTLHQRGHNLAQLHV